MKTTRLTWLFLVLALLWSSLAIAQAGTLPAQQFQPPPGGDNNFIGLMGSGVVPHLQPSFGVSLNYAYKPLVLTICPDCRESSLIRHHVAGDFLASIGFFDALELGIAIPVTFFQNSDALALGMSQASVYRSTTGDIRLVPKWRFWRFGARGGVALAAIVTLPSGGEGSMQGNASATVEPRVIFDYALHRQVHLGVNLGYIVRKQQALFNVDVGNELTYGLALDWHILPDRLSLIGEIAGKTALDPDSTISWENNPMESLFGLRYRTKTGHSVTVGAGPGISQGYGTPQYRVFAGYSFTTPGKPERKVCFNHLDPCPYEAHETGCCPNPDRDGDGICDPWVTDWGYGGRVAHICKGRDLCPDDPEDFDGFEDEDGCPEPDNDGDGICDPWVADMGLSEKYAFVCRGVDLCPDEAEDFDGFEDDDGCPDPDNDQDGVCDPWVEEQGLSEKYANICQGSDQCPNVPGPLSNDGCPVAADLSLARIEGQSIQVMDVILFFFDKTDIKPESYPVIDAVSTILRDNPQITRVRIEGHTDLKGGVAYNKRLSKGRAHAVQQYLVDKGIDPSRLEHEGYGKSKPLVSPEKTPDDAQANRRVEFIILQTADVAN